MKKIALIIVDSRKNAALTVMVRMPHLQAPEMIIGSLLLFFPQIALDLKVFRYHEMAVQSAKAHFGKKRQLHIWLPVHAIITWVLQ